MAEGEGLRNWKSEDMGRVLPPWGQNNLMFNFSLHLGYFYVTLKISGDLGQHYSWPFCRSWIIWWKLQIWPWKIQSLSLKIVLLNFPSVSGFFIKIVSLEGRDIMSCKKVSTYYNTFEFNHWLVVVNIFDFISQKMASVDYCCNFLNGLCCSFD